MLAYFLSMISEEAHSSASECVSCGCWEGSELFWHLGGCVCTPAQVLEEF
jgi:hypothetical protein